MKYGRVFCLRTRVVLKLRINIIFINRFQRDYINTNRLSILIALFRV